MLPAGRSGHTVASRRIMRGVRTLGLLLLLAGIPASASAVTIDQIVSLKKAGVTDAVVLALIDRDHTVFSLQPEQIVALQKDGLSETIIIAMLKSGQDGGEAASAESAYSSAAVAAAISQAPEVVIVGHGPERPDTYHVDGFFENHLTAGLAPYSVFPAAYGFSVAGRPRLTPRGGALQSRALCYAQVASTASRSNAPAFVTECPRVLQPSRAR